MSARLDTEDPFSVYRSTIRWVHNEARKLYWSSDTDPGEGSIAFNELQFSSSRENTRTALMQGEMLVEISTDHLTAFAKTLELPVETIAPWTCVRSAIESSALGVWLMAPEIGRKCRILRALLFRHEGLRQQMKFLSQERMSERETKARDRIREVESQLRSIADADLGRRLKKSKPEGKSRLMPSVTEIVGNIPGKDQAYRLLSAIAHGHFWALHRQSFGPIESEQLRAVSSKGPPDRTEILHTKRLSAQSVAYLSCELLDSFLAILWNKFKLYGCDTNRLVVTFRQSYERMGVQPSVGFYTPSESDRMTEQ